LTIVKRLANFRSISETSEAHQMLKTALLTLSIIVVAFGLILSGMFLFANDGIPLIALLTGIALIIQGGFTIAYLGGALDAWKEWATQLFVSGEVASVLAGGLAFVQGFLYNMHPRNGDYEFGPMGLGVFMAAHAIVGLTYASSSSTLRRTQSL
jgi:cytochrome b561